MENQIRKWKKELRGKKKKDASTSFHRVKVKLIPKNNCNWHIIKMRKSIAKWIHREYLKYLILGVNV